MLPRLVLLTALFGALFLFPTAASAATACAPDTTCAALAIYKSGPSVVSSGDSADFTFTVYNTGNEDISDVVVTDDHCSPVSGPSGDTGNDGILTPFYVGDTYETWTYTCSYKIVGDPGSYVDNVAHVEGVAEDGAVSADSYPHRTWINGLVVDKQVDLTSADPYDVLHYTITVSNVGGEGAPAYDLPAWGVEDEGCSDLQPVDGESQGWFLAPGDSVQFTCHYDDFNPGEGDDGKYVNTACAGAYLDYGEVALSSVYDESPPVTACGSATTTLAQHVVTGSVFEDLNADGIRQSGEPALPGIVLYADLNNNGVRDSGEPSATSDAAGNYSLAVALGTTVIRQDVPSGTTCSFPAGCAYTVDLAKNAAPAPPVLSRAVAGRATDPSGKDFGDWRPASVSGTVANRQGALSGVPVYADLNSNGTLDQGEPSATTAADGSYSIAGLTPGGYVIRHVLPADGSTCVSPAGCSYELTLVSNATADHRDFLDDKPGQLVLPERIIPGVARLTGKTGCIAGRGFSARIRGRQMLRVIFFVDGRAVKAIVGPRDGRVYSYRVDITRLKVGRHTLAVQVTYSSRSHTRNRTLRLSFQRCAAQLRAPRFTG